MNLQKASRILFCIGTTILLLTGCTAKEADGEKEKKELLSQKTTQEGKIPVTVLVKYAFSINAFEKVVEEKFPELDIIQVGNYTSDIGRLEYERRLQNDDLTDIVMTWPLEVGEEYWEERLIDLSAMEFTGEYHLSMLDQIAKDGKLYYLPGPAEVRGIVYNKTLFKEKGWEVPTDFDSFVGLCQTIEASGMRSLQLGFENAEVLDTAFVGYSLSDCYSTPKDAAWMDLYNSGQGNFKQQMQPAFRTFEKMIEAGIWKVEDLEVSYAERAQMIFNRECAMVEDSVLLTRMGESMTGTKDEFALMPFFNPEGEDWARLYMVCYIGLNKHLQEPENKEKYDLVVDVMNYISTVEGQNALAADTGAMYSSVKGVGAPDTPEIEAIKKTLEEGRYAIFPEFKNVQAELREGLASILKGDATTEEVMNELDKANREKKNEVKQVEVVAKATENFTLTETGSFIADTIRSYADTEIGLFLDNGMDGRYNAKGVSGKIYKGEQTKEDILRIFPVLQHGEKGSVQIVKMSGENLRKTLEYAIVIDNNADGWFYYFSGLKMEYDPTAEPGKRIVRISDEKGNPIELDKIYTIAAMDDTLPREYIVEGKDTEKSIVELLTETMLQKGTISPIKDDRFIIPE